MAPTLLEGGNQNAMIKTFISAEIPSPRRPVMPPDDTAVSVIFTAPAATDSDKFSAHGPVGAVLNSCFVLARSAMVSRQAARSAQAGCPEPIVKGSLNN